jgi:hypothetical protein
LANPSWLIRLGAALPQETFLRDGSDQRTIALEDRAPGKTPGTTEVWAVLSVQKPFIGAEWAVKP